MSAPHTPPAPTHLDWQREDGTPVHALWRSEAGVPCPKRWRVVDDTTSADVAYKLACEGTALIWQGDFQNARHLLQALGRRIDKQAERHAERKKAQAKAKPQAASTADGTHGEESAPLTPQQRAAQAFHQHRHTQGQRASVLGRLLIPLEAGFDIALRRAPDWQQACSEVYGHDSATGPSLASLRELLGLVGAHEWRKKGVPIAALKGQPIHAHYGVFSPVRGEYIDLVAQAPLPPALKHSACAFDIGVGTGVLSAVLAKRGIEQVLATDQDARALACAQGNLQRLGVLAPQGAVTLLKTDLFPDSRAPLIVCNPPWVPAKPSSPIEHAVYDPDSRMLRGFLQGLAAHLMPQGEGWLILSDLAEHLGLRSREQLLGWIEAAGLQVIDRLDVRPHHPKAQDANDPLHQARRKEVTSLWRLGPRLHA
ncbi:MAG: hypothetical protein RI907_3019 [Pseudomonadota bacterium]|jgi:methylase of polypeptide subunit release factors